MSEVAIYRKVGTVPNSKTPAEVLPYYPNGSYIIVVDDEITSKVWKQDKNVTLEVINMLPEQSSG